MSLLFASCWVFLQGLATCTESCLPSDESSCTHDVGGSDVVSHLQARPQIIRGFGALIQQDPKEGGRSDFAESGAKAIAMLANTSAVTDAGKGARWYYVPSAASLGDPLAAVRRVQANNITHVWEFATLGAALEAGGAVCMKRVQGFRNPVAIMQSILIVAANAVATYILLQSTDLGIGWAMHSELELLFVVLLSSWVFEEAISRIAWIGVLLTMICLFCLARCRGPDPVRHAVELGYVGIAVTATLCFVNMFFMVWATQRVRWTNQWKVHCLVALALVSATGLEVMTSILLYSGHLHLGILSCQATLFSIIVLLEFMSLHSGWVILTCLDYIIVEILACYLFGEPPNLALSASLFMGVLSILILVLVESNVFQQRPPLPDLEPQVSVACDHIKRMRQTQECHAPEATSHRVVVLIGVGAVGQLVLHELCKMNEWIAIVVVDEADPQILTQGIGHLGTINPIFIQHRFARQSFDTVLENLDLTSTDVIVDLGHNISSWTFCRFCHARGLHYVNAACSEFGVLNDFMPLNDQIDQFRNRTRDIKHKGATSLVFFGMNPGLVTHCAKKAVLDLAERKGFPMDASSDEAKVLEDAAEWLRVSMIDVTEIDTQECIKPRLPKDFISSWSPIAFHQELFDESIWYDGTKNGLVRGGLPACDNCKVSACLGDSVDGKCIERFTGYTVSHEEVFTIPLLFKKSRDLRTRFIYKPSQQMQESLLAAKWIPSNNLPLVRNIRSIATDSKQEGFNVVGTYVATKDGAGQWVGLKVTARQAWDTWGAVGNATSWLTARGIMIAINVCLESPDMGVCTPEDVPLDLVAPYIQPFMHSVAADEVLKGSDSSRTSLLHPWWQSLREAMSMGQCKLL